MSRSALERVESVDDPRISDFRDIREAELARTRGIFIAEGTGVVRTMVLASRFPVRAILVAERHIETMRDVLERAEQNAPVFVARQEVINAIAGFDLHRGCLASGDRAAIPGVEALLAAMPERATVLVLEELANHDNVGAMFRNAAAFGANAVLLGPRCADPLYRKSIRVSMGAALTVPFARLEVIPGGLELLQRHGFELWALTPAAGAEELAAARPNKPRIALMFGAEGPGLTAEALASADRRVRIDIEPNVDSINVATAAAIALYRVKSC